MVWLNAVAAGVGFGSAVALFWTAVEWWRDGIRPAEAWWFVLGCATVAMGLLMVVVSSGLAYAVGGPLFLCAAAAGGAGAGVLTVRRLDAVEGR